MKLTKLETQRRVKKKSYHSYEDINLDKQHLAMSYGKDKLELRL